MTKHTPGPWRINHHSHIYGELWLSVLDGAFDITHNGAAKPCVVACSRYSAMSDEENLANARLIAAAPELLEALKEAVQVCKSAGSLPIVWEKWKQIIAKAEGA